MASRQRNSDRIRCSRGLGRARRRETVISSDCSRRLKGRETVIRSRVVGG